jgi:hypothetical protein
MMMRRLVAALMLTGIAAGGMCTYLRSHTYRTTRYTIDGHAIDEVTTDVATDSGSWTLSARHPVTFSVRPRVGRWCHGGWVSVHEPAGSSRTPSLKPAPPVLRRC